MTSLHRKRELIISRLPGFFLFKLKRERNRSYLLFVIHNTLVAMVACKNINEVHCKPLCDFKILSVCFPLFLTELIVIHTYMTGQKSTQS